MSYTVARNSMPFLRMPKGTVIAVDRSRDLFAVHIYGDDCAIFFKLFGPELEIGDYVTGDLFATGPRLIEHENGQCGVNGDTGSMSCSAAKKIVAGPQDST